MSVKGTAFISDLHLGDRRWNTEQTDLLLDFLDKFVSSRVQHLIVIGDALEICQCGLVGALKTSVPALSKLFELTSSGLKLTYVVGNHDIHLSLFRLASPNLTFEYPRLHTDIDGLSFHAEHGHYYQPEYRNFPGAYNFLAAWGGKLVDTINPELEDRLGDFVKAVTSSKSTSQKGDAERRKDCDVYVRAAQELARNKHDYVLFGHTHDAERVALNVPGPNTDDATYINTGDWIVHSDFVYVRDGEVHLHRWSDDRKTLLKTA